MNKRREFEMAVIDAAMAVDTKMTQAGWIRTDVEEALHEAVIRYSLYGLAEPRFTRTVHSAPDTSHEAGEWMRKFALTDAADVFRRIYNAWRSQDGAAYYADIPYKPLGLTCDEIEVELVRTHQSMSARVNQLRDSGWIVDSGVRRKTRSGRDAIVWTPSKAALDLVNRVGLPIPVSTTRKESSGHINHQ